MIIMFADKLNEESVVVFDDLLHLPVMNEIMITVAIVSFLCE